MVATFTQDGPYDFQFLILGYVVKRSTIV